MAAARRWTVGFDCGGYQTDKFGSVPYVEATAVLNGGALTVFAVNRHLSESVSLELDLTGFGALEFVEHIRLSGKDLKAVNTASDPENIKPSAGETGGLTALLEKHSWNVIRYRQK